MSWLYDLLAVEITIGAAATTHADSAVLAQNCEGFVMAQFD